MIKPLNFAIFWIKKSKKYLAYEPNFRPLNKIPSLHEYKLTLTRQSEIHIENFTCTDSAPAGPPHGTTLATVQNKVQSGCSERKKKGYGLSLYQMSHLD